MRANGRGPESVSAGKKGSIVRTTTDRADVGTGVRPSWTPTDDRASGPARDNLGFRAIILKAFPSTTNQLKGSRTSINLKGLTTRPRRCFRTVRMQDRPLDRLIEGAVNRAGRRSKIRPDQAASASRMPTFQPSP